MLVDRYSWILSLAQRYEHITRAYIRSYWKFNMDSIVLFIHWIWSEVFEESTRKNYAITCIVIAIFTSLVVSKSIRDNALSMIGIVLLLWQNIKYLCGTVIYLLATARIFKIDFQETNAYKKLAATYFGSFGSFVTKLVIALVFRLAYQTTWTIIEALIRQRMKKRYAFQSVNFVFCDF